MRSSLIVSVLIGVASLLSQSYSGTATETAALPSARLSHTNLLVYHNRSGKERPVKSVRDWKKRRAEIRVHMQEVMGPLPGRKKRCPLDVQLIEETDRGLYVMWSITYAAEPGGRVPAYVLIPKIAFRKKIKLPGVLALHQTHRLGNKVVVGLGDSPNDQYGVELAERGYVVLAPAYPLLAEYHPDLKALGYVSGTMKAIWNNVRGLDLLDSLPFVRPGRFAAIGHSLGGHNSIYTAVFDERLKVIVSSCGFDSYRDYMDGNIKGWASERYMPRLLSHKPEEIPFDFHELIGALSPRSCFVSAPLGDTNFKWRSVDSVTEAARPVYHLFGAEKKLQVEHPDCGHLFPREMREAAYQMIDSELRRSR
ncbi:MAG: alpha/beta hydrolase [Verrucomicrobiales bacterium]|nr:alpha/beta hydrolase [Verrucomicrobiales bacterium]